MTAGNGECRVRRKVKRLCLRAIKNGSRYRITDKHGQLLHTGPLATTEAYLAGRYVNKQPSAVDPRYKPPVARAWQQAIDDFLLTLAAAGQPPTTIGSRRQQLTQMARELRGGPSDVTGEKLVAWFGGHAEWALETRRGSRAAARRFFHFRDLIDSFDGAQLLVHGKGGKGGKGGHRRCARGCAEFCRPTGNNLRHRFASRAYNLGTRDLRSVQVLLGHASVATTQRYIAVNDAQVRATAACAW